MVSALEAKLPQASAHLDAAQDDILAFTESRRYMGPEILAARRKTTAGNEMGVTDDA